MNDHLPSAEPIECYLDELLLTLSGSPRRIRHTLSEAEAHLRDTAEELERAGLEPLVAEQLSVQRMGPARGLTAQASIAALLTPARRRRLVLAALLIGGVAGLAIGFSTGVAAVARVVGGDRAIASPFPVGSYTTADCQRWMRLYPSAPNCVTAQTIDHASDFIRNGVLAGAAGVIVLGVFAFLKRRWSALPVDRSLPATSEAIVGGGLALLAALATLAVGVDSALVTRGAAEWQWFSLAAGALAACGYFVMTGRRRVYPAFVHRAAPPSPLGQ